MGLGFVSLAGFHGVPQLEEFGAEGRGGRRLVGDQHRLVVAHHGLRRPIERAGGYGPVVDQHELVVHQPRRLLGPHDDS